MSRHAPSKLRQALIGTVGALLACSACTGDPSALCDQGDQLSSQGRYRDAIRLYNTAIAQHADYGRAYLNRGIAYDQLKEYDRALEDFNQAIKLCAADDQYRKEYFYNRGMCFYRLKRYDEAVKDYTEALKSAPEDPSFYGLRGRSYRELNKFDEALSDFEKSISLHQDPDEQASSLVHRGLTYKKMNEPDKALSDFTRSIELFEKGYTGDRGSLRGSKHLLPAALFERSALYKQMNKSDLAARDDQRLQELDYTPGTEHRLPETIE